MAALSEFLRALSFKLNTPGDPGYLLEMIMKSRLSEPSRRN
jgi:hypothetical protein